MKKYISIIVALLFSLTPIVVSATSGACSYHAGVDCSAGAAVDGNAICNDGTESSVSYSSMEECQVSTVSDFCSSAFPVQEITDYVTASDDTVRQLIKSEINGDIQSANQALTYDEQQLNSLVQSDTSMWNATIQQDQLEQTKALGTANAVMGQSGTAPWSSSNDQGTLNNINSQYSSDIQNAQNDESVSIQQANAQFQPSINSASQCVSSLNRLSSTLNTYQPPVTTTSQQTVNTATANTSIQPSTTVPATGFTCQSTPTDGNVCCPVDATMDAFYQSKGAVYDALACQYVCPSTGQVPPTIAGIGVVSCPASVPVATPSQPSPTSQPNISAVESPVITSTPPPTMPVQVRKVTPRPSLVQKDEITQTLSASSTALPTVSATSTTTSTTPLISTTTQPTETPQPSSGFWQELSGLIKSWF